MEKLDAALAETEFEDVTLDRVTRQESGWWDVGFDGCGIGIPPETPVKPVVGMTLRMIPGGIGGPNRGMLLDGQLVYYRTPAEEKEHREIESYGADAADWLKRWDEGKSVWSIEMGGMGPGYEQCIHITAAELLRLMLAHKFDADLWKDSDVWKSDRDLIDKEVFEVPAVKALGLSGAQFGAAMSLASKLYMDGPRKIMSDPAIKDRHILVSKSFP